MVILLLACVGSVDDNTDAEKRGPDTDPPDTDTGEEPVIDACEREAAVIDAVGTLDTDATWCPQDTVTLRGRFVVPEGRTLTLAPGTVVTATWGEDGSTGELTIEGKIFAEGTPDEPIVLTGLGGGIDPSEWEGLKVYGRAPGQRYPDGDPAHSSGVLEYVRVEYGGFVDAAVHLISVGTGTRIRHMASILSADDGFEFDGGTVEAQRLVIRGCHDDGFQTEDGFTGSIHHSLVDDCGGAGITLRNRDPDDTGTGSTTSEPRTMTTAWNLTFIDTWGEGIYYDNGGQGHFSNILLDGSSHCAFRADDVSVEAAVAGGLSLHHALFWDADENFCATEDGEDTEQFTEAILVADPLLQGDAPEPGSPALDAANADTTRDGYIGAMDDEDDWIGAWGEL